MGISKKDVLKKENSMDGGFSQTLLMNSTKVILKMTSNTELANCGKWVRHMKVLSETVNNGGMEVWM